MDYAIALKILILKIRAALILKIIVENSNSRARVLIEGWIPVVLKKDWRQVAMNLWNLSLSQFKNVKFAKRIYQIQ